MEEPECFLTATDRSEGVEDSENFLPARKQEDGSSLFGLFSFPGSRDKITAGYF